MTSRRQFISLLGGAAAAWPVAVRAQQATPVVAWLYTGSRLIPRDMDAFRKGVGEAGYVEGRNLTVEVYATQGELDRLPGLATELARRPVAVIVTGGGVAPAEAAKRATSNVPIVFVLGSDPVATGLVVSLSRPGGNITGVTFLTGVLQAKFLELLHQAVPTARVIDVLFNPKSATRELRLIEVEEAARKLDLTLRVTNVSSPYEFDDAFSNLVQQRCQALLVVADPMFRQQHSAISARASKYAIPMMSFARDFAEAGGLMTYGTDFGNSFREVGQSVGRILKGAKPADLPVLQATKFELVLNLKTAKTLGIDIPPTLLALADEVIE
jgi:putative ABC transport system substrate-binding protein